MYHELSFNGLEKLSINQILSFSNFLIYTRPKVLKELFLDWSSLNYLMFTSQNEIEWEDIPHRNITRLPPPNKNYSANYYIYESFLSFLPWVTERLYLMKFAISSSQLKSILETGHKLKEIDLIRCEIDLNDEFTLSSSIDFNIKVLNLRWSWVKNDRFFLDETKLELFVKVISGTTLKGKFKYLNYRLYSWCDCQRARIPSKRSYCSLQKVQNGSKCLWLLILFFYVQPKR